MHTTVCDCDLYVTLERQGKFHLRMLSTPEDIKLTISGAQTLPCTHNSHYEKTDVTMYTRNFYKKTQHN